VIRLPDDRIGFGPAPSSRGEAEAIHRRDLAGAIGALDRFGFA